MNTHPFLRGAAILACAISTTFAAGPGASNDFGGKRVLVIGVDGLRADALQVANTPRIDALIAQGVVTHQAFAGGVLSTGTQQPTVSGPGWASITTGVWRDKHKIIDNSFSGYKNSVASNYPHFFKRLKDAYPNAYVSSVVSWAAIEDFLISKVSASVNYHVKGVGGNYAERDLDVKNKAVAHLASANPDVLFLHFDQVDGAGHSTGFSPSNTTYLNAIAAVDAHIGSVMDAIAARPQAAQEKWLVVFTTDHGGTGTSHGGQTSEERNITLFVSGSVVNAPHQNTATPGHTVVPSTAMKYLGVPIDSAWGWEGSPFGLPPYSFSSVSGSNVNLNWVLPAAGLPGLTGFEVRRNGAVIATLPSGTLNYADAPGVGSHTYEVRFLGTTETRVSTASVAGNLNDQLVVHLPFDGNVQDASGRGNHGSVSGTPSFVAGKSGQCLQFSDVATPHQFVNLGQPADLQFGSATSFNVSVWVNHSGAFSDNRASGGSASDPAILSNKDWNSGALPGWILAAGPDGRWQWNAGDGVDRSDYDGPASQLSDGQ